MSRVDTLPGPAERRLPATVALERSVCQLGSKAEFFKKIPKKTARHHRTRVLIGGASALLTAESAFKCFTRAVFNLLRYSSNAARP